MSYKAPLSNNQVQFCRWKHDVRQTQNISSVSKILGVPAHTIRYWEKEFSAFLSPQRPNGGHRRYGANEVDLLKKIKYMLKEEKYSIAGARQKLNSTLIKSKSSEQQVVPAKLAIFLADNASAETVLKGQSLCR